MTLTDVLSVSFDSFECAIPSPPPYFVQSLGNIAVKSGLHGYSIEQTKRLRLCPEPFLLFLYFYFSRLVGVSWHLISLLVCWRWVVFGLDMRFCLRFSRYFVVNVLFCWYCRYLPGPPWSCGAALRSSRGRCHLRLCLEIAALATKDDGERLSRIVGFDPRRSYTRPRNLARCLGAP